MNPTPNTSAIRHLAAVKSQNARKRVVEVLKTLSKTGQPVSFNAVSKAANVSKTFLYDPKHADLADHIRRLRSAPAQRQTQSTSPTNKTDAAKDVQLARLKERIQAAERELRELQRENEVLWGRLAQQQQPF